MAAFLDDLMSGLNSDQGLLGLAMLSAAAPKERRATIGEGLLSGMSLVNQRRLQREEQAMREKEMRMREQDFGLRQRMSGLQEQQILQAIAAQKLQQQESERQLSRNRAIEALPAQFVTPGVKPDTMDNRDVGQPGEQRVPSQGFDLAGYANAMMAFDPKTALAYQQLLKKDTKPIKLGKDDRLIAPDSYRTIIDALPDAGKQSPLAQLISEMSALPPGHPARKTYEQAILKASTHQPQVSVSYGAPVAGVGPDGNPVFFQPSKDGSAPSIVPGVRPPAPKLGEGQQKQVSGIDALGSAIDEYVKALGTWKKEDALNANKRAQMGTFYNNMMLQAKEAYNLGVLNGPDYQILQSVVRDPTSMMGAVTSNESLKFQANTLKRMMGKTRAAITKQPGGGSVIDEADAIIGGK